MTPRQRQIVENAITPSLCALTVADDDELKEAIEALLINNDRLKELLQNMRMYLRRTKHFEEIESIEDFDRVSYELIHGEPYTDDCISSKSTLKLIYGRYWT